MIARILGGDRPDVSGVIARKARGDRLGIIFVIHSQIDAFRTQVFGGRRESIRHHSPERGRLPEASGLFSPRLVAGYRMVSRSCTLAWARVVMQPAPRLCGLMRARAAEERAWEAGYRDDLAANPLTAHCPVSAPRAWLDAAGIQDGLVFQRNSRREGSGGRFGGEGMAADRVGR